MQNCLHIRKQFHMIGGLNVTIFIMYSLSLFIVSNVETTQLVLVVVLKMMVRMGSVSSSCAIQLQFHY